jgi:hypothetical protein
LQHWRNFCISSHIRFGLFPWALFSLELQTAIYPPPISRSLFQSQTSLGIIRILSFFTSQIISTLSSFSSSRPRFCCFKYGTYGGIQNSWKIQKKKIGAFMNMFWRSKSRLNYYELFDFFVYLLIWNCLIFLNLEIIFYF